MQVLDGLFDADDYDGIWERSRKHLCSAHLRITEPRFRKNIPVYVAVSFSGGGFFFGNLQRFVLFCLGSVFISF